MAVGKRKFIFFKRRKMIGRRTRRICRPYAYPSRRTRKFIFFKRRKVIGRRTRRICRPYAYRSWSTRKFVRRTRIEVVVRVNLFYLTVRKSVFCSDVLKRRFVK